jgi:hypothetical protein
MRGAKLFFGGFTLAFGVASIVYAFAPDLVTAQFAQMDVQLGGGGADYTGPQCRVWTSLAAANVATLCLMCALLTRDLVAHATLRWPLLFMKGLSALLFTVWWVAMPGARSLLVAAAGDFATAFGIWYFATQGLKAARAGATVASPAPG